MYCTLKSDELVEIEHNGDTYMCSKNCCNQEELCDYCDYEDCMEGCEVHDLLGSCSECEINSNYN